MRRPVVAGRTGLEVLDPATTAEGDCVKVPREGDDGTKALERATVAAKRSEISATRRRELLSAFAILMLAVGSGLCLDMASAPSSFAPVTRAARALFVLEMPRNERTEVKKPGGDERLATRHHIMLVQAESEGKKKCSAMSVLFYSPKKRPMH